ncbi:MAG: tonB-system energizer ExbB [Pseudomonadales bacterium]|nr:tonB-system energizer ExbB [Pseudomonadales bacterium]
MVAGILLFSVTVQAEDVDQTALASETSDAIVQSRLVLETNSVVAQPEDLTNQKAVSVNTVETTEQAAEPNSVVHEKPTATLPHNLSPWGMFMAADWVVKAVMVGLAIASLLTWTVLVAKSIELGSVKRQLKNSLGSLNGAGTLSDVAHIHTLSDVGRELVDAAEAELKLSADMLARQDSDNAFKEGVRQGIKERVISRISRIEVAISRNMMTGTGLLATVGTVAPFVGLFGTVWGIMNSFIGISEANTTNLAVVAPGIAEALLATALGLVAAIPAVVIYNHFTRKIAAIKALVSDNAAAVMRLLSRDLDRGLVRGMDLSSIGQKPES